jgi:dipeptidyl aminopeptidase/acylaminoacyl peptidase
MTTRIGRIVASVAALVLLTGAAARAADAAPSLEAMLAYPFDDGLVAAPRGGVIAWARNVKGVRNIWLARGPGFIPRQVTANHDDDGQELSDLAFSPDGTRLVWVRGGDHDANWPAEGGLAPDPASDPSQPEMTIWTAAVEGGAPVPVAKGDAPAISARGVLAFVKDRQVWTAPLTGKGKAERLFFDRGHDDELVWSPDGSKLAFVSDRGDHAFIGVYSGKDRPIQWLAPSTGQDGSPRWSADGTRIAFTRRRGAGGAPAPILTQTPDPWSIWVADVASGAGRAVWRSPETLDGSYPDTAGEANLGWAGEALTFLSEADGWPHLYAVPAAGGEARLLTPGPFMVEHVARSRDGRTLIYSANAGPEPGDAERRHIFSVRSDGGPPGALTAGTSLDWAPVAADDADAAFITAGAQALPAIAVARLGGGAARPIEAAPPQAEFPSAALVTPTPVSFTAPDGLTVHATLFQSPVGAGSRPGVIFVHGGPPRQMLLGWHYMDYYSNAYAVNQYLAAHGFVVLSVNYRLGIGYGRAFQHPPHAGPTGAAEYQDVLAGARYLRGLAGVDPARIGIWGGSYGGYLTAMALARDSATFKAGVDMHGVHDWSRLLARELADPDARFERGDRDQAMAIAWTSSPDADVARWRSPVLLIQGDDDRNVPFHQTVDLARRLEDQHVAVDELVLPDEIHGFLRHAAWLAADAATVKFLEEHLGAGAK